MKFHVVQEDQTIWVNTAARYFHNLAELFKFSLPVSTPFYLSALYLNFQREGLSPEDTIEVTISSSEKDSLYYTVKLADVPPGSPIKLECEMEHLFQDVISVSIKFNSFGNGAVSIGLNEKGPCLAIVGKVKEDIELNDLPLISIVTPVYNDNLELFKKTYESVVNQVYTNWEWVIVEDCSKNKDIRKFLKSIENEKINISFNRKNEGIVYSSNKAIADSKGSYIAFLDDDDLLTTDALLRVAAEINKNKDLLLIYSDEDKVTLDGQLVDQFFKPDWSYDMLLSQNYICHLAVYEAILLATIGGLREEYEGSQDYDLLLRFSEFINLGKEVKHIPKILYHWRKDDHSTSSGISNKPYAHLSALKALKDHLLSKEEYGAKVTVGRYLGTYRVDHNLDLDKVVHIIIPTRDNPVYLETCYFSLLQSSYLRYTVTVVNNSSKDKKTLELFDRISGTVGFDVLDYDKPFNFSAINNFAVGKAKKADAYIFLNDDTEVVTRDWIEVLLQHMGKNNVAVAGPKLLYSDNRLQHAGVIIGIGGVAGHSHKRAPDGLPGYFSRPHIVQNLSAVTGACLMIDAKVFREVGRFEEGLPKAFNDIDLCLKVREAGYNIVYNPNACLFHHESVSRGLDNSSEPIFAKAVEYMQNRWDCKNFKDPYYNPNLTLIDENFSFRVGI